nr:helix-turn-helix domain-containing protein [Kibdelosporangium phytohabitans]
MVLLDLLGRRWALRVIWELRGAAQTFRQLQSSCDGMSSSVLSARLDELRAADVVGLGASGYHLTGEGRELLALFEPLDAWARRWAERDHGSPS